MELLPPEPNREVEQQPITPEQLREASLDLRLAIRSKVSKARSMHRQKLKLWAEKQKPTGLSVDQYVKKLAQTDKLPTDAKLREMLRNSQRVVAGTGMTEGRMVHHSYGVFEDEHSAMLPNRHPEAHLVITHITKKVNRLEGLIQMSPEAFHESEIEVPLYTIDIVGQTITANQGARRLEADELNLPYDIISQARLLYVPLPKEVIE